ncbi:MAG: hypothetical protein ACI4WG_04975 [Erysipelotrichaceae bacterium]
MSDLLTLLVGCALANNLVLTKGFGSVNSVSSVDNKKILKTGLFIALVMVVSAVICWPLQQYLIAKFNLTYLQNLIYVAVIVAVSAVCTVSLKRCKRTFILTVFNSALLACCLLNATNGYTFVEMLFATVGTALGLLLAMYLYNGAISRVKQNFVVDCFKGLPIKVLTLAIVVLAVMAFK